jgi:ABC-type sugar transport system ATPase subunit
VGSDRVILETSGIAKEFSRVRILGQIDFDLKYSEAHALVRENDDGKSTFRKILTGVDTRDSVKIGNNL